MNPVDQLKNEFSSIETFLESKGEISLLSDFRKSFRKVLLLSAGSYFEHRVVSILSEFVRKKSNDNRIVSFLEKQAISGKYHQLFSWGEKDNPEKPIKNANTFWKLFGDEFKREIENELNILPSDDEIGIKDKKKLTQSIEAFIEIGHLRNILVHSNFADYNYENKTGDEIYSLFQAAEPFIDFLERKLN